MVMKSIRECKKAYVFLLLAACLFLVVSLAFAEPTMTCKHCGNETACDWGDPNTQEGYEFCMRDEGPPPWCFVYGEFGDCDYDGPF